MKPRVMYIENKSTRLNASARIGRVTFSKTGKSLYYRGRRFQTLSGRGFKANYFDCESGEHYWISGCKRNGQDRLYPGRIEIDSDVRDDGADEVRDGEVARPSQASQCWADYPKLAMKVARALVVALWTTLAVLLSVFVATIGTVPLVMEHRLSPAFVPWVFGVVAIGASVVAALVSATASVSGKGILVAAAHLAGVLGWPLAWWIGMNSKDAFEAANGGTFAITTTLEHASFWNGAIALVAFLVLLGQRGASPDPSTSGPFQGGA